MFEWNEEDQRLEAMHHPFTAPNPDDLASATPGLQGARALAYDLVYNGLEVAGENLGSHPASPA
jgi:aspartyl-tRNA synthetase